MSNTKTTRPPAWNPRKPSADPVLPTMNLAPTPMPENGDLQAGVLMAAMEWPIRLVNGRLLCCHCGQNTIALAQNGRGYTVTPSQIVMTVTAHMIQVHKWTREGPPNE